MAEATKTIKTDRLTRQMVKELEKGVAVAFVFPDYYKVLSARQTIVQMRKLMKADIKCSETGENTITVERYD